MPSRKMAGIVLAAAAVLAGLYGFERFGAKRVTGADTPTIAQLPWTEIQQALPVDREWQAFAEPLAIGTHDMLLFQRGKAGTARIWHIDWRSGRLGALLLDDVAPKNGGSYVARWSKAGLWLLGDRTQLIRPDGSRLSIEGDLTRGAAVALDDGSILRLNANKALFEQLIPGRERIEVQPRGPLSFDGRPLTLSGKALLASDNPAIVKLNDGRVLLLGSRNSQKLASIISPRSTPASWSVTPASAMPHFHESIATAVLADGRVAVAGGSSCDGNIDDPPSVDLYDPAHDQWMSLPALPFQLCQEGPASLAVTPDGSLVAGGHGIPNILVLRRDPASANGFATDWTVHGPLPDLRLGGIVQAPSNDEVVIAGGSRSSGFDKVSIADAEGNPRRMLDAFGAAAARRGTLLFAGGGQRFEAGQWNYSSYAELIDLRSGKAQQIPHIPFMSRAVEARWLDDDRILVKGRFWDKQDGDGFTEDRGGPYYLPPSSGSLAVYSIKAHRWSTTIAGPEIDRSDLLDVNDHEALLLSSSGVLQRLNLQTMDMYESTELPRKMKGGAVRWLSDDRLLIAGGEVPADWISVVDDACEAARHTECPERYAGIGRFMPSASYQWIAPGHGTPREAMSKSMTGETPYGHSKVLGTAITREGLVYFLFDDEEHKTIRFLRSGNDDTGLQSLPLPQGIDPSTGSYTLQLAADPREAGHELLFLRSGWMGSTEGDDSLAKQPVKVWLWNAAQSGWQEVLATDAWKARSTPQPLAGVDAGPGGGKILSMGWHLTAPVLWIAQNP